MRFKEFINLKETPQWEPDVRLRSNYISSEMTTEINEYLQNDSMGLLYNPKDNLYIIEAKTYEIFFYANIEFEFIHAAVRGYEPTSLKYNSHKLFCTALTNKYDPRFSNAALKLYSYISKHKNPYLISDRVHTDASKRIWQTWLRNPSKFGIDEIFLFNTKTKNQINDTNLDAYWGSGTEYQKYRVIVKFSKDWS